MGIFKYWKLNVHTLPKVFMTLRAAALLLVFDILFGVTGFVLLEGYSIPDAFFMVVITLSTVGYGEVHPLSPTGKVFTSVFILMNIGLFAYFLAVFPISSFREKFLKVCTPTISVIISTSSRTTSLFAVMENMARKCPSIF
ncbi:MAG: two pore domain potassium channel family protein [Haliscomenobacter sp.]|nr:two pore domain potassium channel family protein [Haliscomenobacter sp.]